MNLNSYWIVHCMVKISFHPRPIKELIHMVRLFQLWWVLWFQSCPPDMVTIVATVNQHPPAVLKSNFNTCTYLLRKVVCLNLFVLFVRLRSPKSQNSLCAFVITIGKLSWIQVHQGRLPLFRTLDNEREFIEIEQCFQRKMFKFKFYFILGKLKP
jgi:hypothetical protein